MIKWTCRAALIALAAATPAFAQAPDLSRMDLVLRSVPDGPVAKVGDVPIGRDEFVRAYQRELALIMSGMHTSNLPDKTRLEAGVRCVMVLVQRELLTQEAKRRKLSVAETELQDKWKAKMADYHKDLTESGEKELSDDEILRRAGYTREIALEELRQSLLVDKVRDQILKEKGVAVTEADIEKFYKDKKAAFNQPDRVHLQQIFMKTRAANIAFDAKKKAEVRERIEKALKRVQSGESFERVAEADSEAPDRKDGGDMGMMPTKALPPFYIEAVASLQPGQLSAIIESDLGYHVIKLIDVSHGGETTLKDAAPKIRELLTAEREGNAVRDFCEPFTKKPGYIQVYLQIEKTLSTMPGFEDLKKKPAPPKSEAQSKPSEKAGSKTAGVDTGLPHPKLKINKAPEASAFAPSADTGSGSTPSPKLELTPPSAKKK